MTHASPCYVDICSYLVASTYPIGASKVVKEQLENDAKYYIWDDPYLCKLCNDQVTRRCILESKIKSEATMDQCGQPKKSLTMGYIGPPSSETRIDSYQPTNSARKLEWL
ncbi:hypothetical protein CR513_13770, partial [Mucuna pruriens]